MDLALLTNSRLRTFRRCQRLHHYLYVLCLRAIISVEELRFGDLVHRGLQRWWEALLHPDLRFAAVSAIERRAIDAGRKVTPVEAAITAALDRADPLEAALAVVSDHPDPYERVRAEEMLRGYHYRWIDAEYAPVAVEVEFRAPLINPMTKAESRTFQLAGKLDVICQRSDGRFVIFEHKTSREDIRAGTEYWRRLRLDTQVSQYYAGARALGYDPVGCVYDVLAKPALRPSAVPLVDGDGVKIVLDAGGQRVRTKDGKKWRETGDAAQGFVLQTRTETPDEYRARLREAIATEPERYFARGDVVRLEEDEREHAFNVWQTAQTMRESERAKRHPMNPDGCAMYGRTCSFFDACTKVASLDDPLRFERVENPHLELGDAAA